MTAGASTVPARRFSNAVERRVDVSVLVPAKDEAENLPLFMEQMDSTVIAARASASAAVGSRDRSAIAAAAQTCTSPTGTRTPAMLGSKRTNASPTASASNASTASACPDQPRRLHLAHPGGGIGS